MTWDCAGLVHAVTYVSSHVQLPGCVQKAASPNSHPLLLLLNSSIPPSSVIYKPLDETCKVYVAIRAEHSEVYCLDQL